MIEFSVTESTELFRGYLVSIDELKVTAQSSTFTREIVRHPGAVAVIALDADSNVLLIRQYRASVDGPILEVAAGTRDVQGEDPCDTARRELLEEIGTAAHSFELLGTVMNSPGYCDQQTSVFLATNLAPATRQPVGPEEESSEVVRVALADALAMVETGEIVDLTTCFALAMVARRHGV